MKAKTLQSQHAYRVLSGAPMITSFKRTVLATLLVAALCGCASGIRSISNPSIGVFSAMPLDITDDQLSKTHPSKREFLGRIAYDSQKKCADFMDRIVAGQQSINTTGDILTTILSGIATAVTPVNTIHALTATSTIVSGTKATLTRELYTTGLVENWQTAIRRNYFKDISDYIAALNRIGENELTVSIEVAKIHSIHSNCSIAAASSQITEKVNKPPVPGPASPNAAPSPSSGAAGKPDPAPAGPSMAPMGENVPVTSGGATPGAYHRQGNW
jgi:hypothetical protein